MVREPGLFDLDDRYRKLSEVGDPLVRLSALINFEVFRPALTKALNRSDGSKGGRPPYDAVLMFKVLVLQTLYKLSDDAAEFQLRDRLSFMRFLGLGLRTLSPTPRRSGCIASN
jgi:IS5 family transposase